MASRKKKKAQEQFDENGAEKVQCRICAGWYHRVDAHVLRAHGMNAEEYLAQHPGAELESERAKELRKRGAAKAWSTRKGKPAVKAGESKPIRARFATKTEVKAEELAEGELRFGCAVLRKREGLAEEDEFYLPGFDAQRQVGASEMDLLEAFALGIESKSNLMLSGPTGAGKTTLAKYVAAIVNQPLIQVPMTGQFTTAQFVGEKTVRVDEDSGQNYVVWIDGILPRAMRRGYWLLIDELDMAPPEVLSVLQAVLEPEGKLLLTENDGEVVEPHPDFRIIATANTLGHGDETGLYQATNPLNEAFLDRFKFTILVDYPDADTEAKIVKAKTGIDGADARRMVSVARRIREAQVKEDCNTTFSTRKLIAWGEAAKRFKSFTKAAKFTVINKVNNGDGELVTAIVQRYFADK